MDVNEVLEKYSKKIGEQVKVDSGTNVKSDFDSQEYEKFKKDMMPDVSRYEGWVRAFGNFIKIKLSAKDDVNIRRQLEVAHLSVEPGEVAGLAIFSFLSIFVIGILSSVSIWFLGGGFPFLFLFLMLITGVFLFYYFYTIPSRLAIKWKLKASSQMVPAILYTVIYMKHTSNLERAISFVSRNLEAPLALDLRKVIWDVETGRFSSIKDSLDNYLEFWRDTNLEFIESFHLIESSLYEPDNVRRVQILERALRVILDGVYERMLKYTHQIKSPLTNIYMLGIVLPTLALALLPLASTMLGGLLSSVHVFVFFNLLIPFFVFYLNMQIMLKRPGGYGETSLLERNPLYPRYKSKRPYYIAGLICLPLFVIGLLPLIFGYFGVDYALSDLGLGVLGKGNLFGFEDGAGPFGVGALLLSLFIPFSVAMFFAMSFSMKTKDLIKSRDNTKILEKEFTSSLFTLGNRLGDGTPAEIAFAKVAESTKGQRTEEFFRIVNTNIQSMGMGLEDAIFNPRRGAIIYFPSALIATSMRILVEGVKKGLGVAAQSLMSISEYVRNINKINERLRDLLADVVSDMKSNMVFLAPLLAGIVVGLGAMITGILNYLKIMTNLGSGSVGVGGFGSVGDITNLFEVTNMIPPYYMQIAIGFYIIEIIFILTGALVIVDSGDDKLKRTHELGKNLIKGSLLYLITAFMSIVALSVLAGVALGGIG